MGGKRQLFFFWLVPYLSVKKIVLMNWDLVGQALYISFFIDLIAARWKCVITFLIIHI